YNQLRLTGRIEAPSERRAVASFERDIKLLLAGMRVAGLAHGLSFRLAGNPAVIDIRDAQGTERQIPMTSEVGQLTGTSSFQVYPSTDFERVKLGDAV